MSINVNILSLHCIIQHSNMQDHISSKKICSKSACCLSTSSSNNNNNPKWNKTSPSIVALIGFKCSHCLYWAIQHWWKSYWDLVSSISHYFVLVPVDVLLDRWLAGEINGQFMTFCHAEAPPINLCSQCLWLSLQFYSAVDSIYCYYWLMANIYAHQAVMGHICTLSTRPIIMGTPTLNPFESHHQHHHHPPPFWFSQSNCSNST